MAQSLFSPLTFAHSPAWRNRFALAPLTNQQSHDDGTLSSEEMNWLLMRARGGFGLTMTCAASVSKSGQGFPGQLGIYDERQEEGLARLATGIRERGSVSAVQLYHGGYRADAALASEVIGPSDNDGFGARGLSTAEVENLRDAFVGAAKRAARAGFDGAEIHGAHSYIITQFLSPELNRRSDLYGGSVENRSRLLTEIIAGIRAECGSGFQLGVRLSPERFGLRLDEMKQVFAGLISVAEVDYIDLSLWDVFKLPEEEAHRDRSLLRHFSEMPRGDVRLGVAGAVCDARAAHKVMEENVDFAMIGRAAILCHDFPRAIEADAEFVPPAAPVSPAYLAQQGVSPAFVDYLRGRFAMVA